MYAEFTAGRKFMGRFEYGSDLLKALTDIVEKEKIQAGKFSVIGAVQKACIGFYPQDIKKYQFLNFDYGMEILSCVGNISLKDGKPFVHAHITLGDKDGNAFGGHLAEGTIIFAGEFIIEELLGNTFEREPDQETGLALWKL